MCTVLVSTRNLVVRLRPYEKPARRSKTSAGPAPESSNTRETFTQKRNDEIYLLAALERGSPSQGGEGTGPHPFVKPLVFLSVLFSEFVLAPLPVVSSLYDSFIYACFEDMHYACLSYTSLYRLQRMELTPSSRP